MKKSIYRNSIIVIIASILIFTFSQSASAAKIRLAWDANTESDLLGYKVYYGTISKSYIDSFDVGNETTYTLTGLTQGQTYFIVVTAYDTSYNESGYSNEVSGTAVELEPSLPTPTPTIVTSPTPDPTPTTTTTSTPTSTSTTTSTATSTTTSTTTSSTTSTSQPTSSVSSSTSSSPSTSTTTSGNKYGWLAKKKSRTLRMYLAFSEMYSAGPPIGNLKSYSISQTEDQVGTVFDTARLPAFDSNNQIKDDSKSYWSSEPDGRKVDKGGVGDALLKREKPRNIFTHFKDPDLVNESNEFSTSNDKLTPELLGLSPKDREGRDKLIRYVHGYDAYGKGKEQFSPDKRKWVLGSIINSRPLVIPYGNSNSVVYVGANDGMFHAFDDRTGEELWAFIPYELLGRLKSLTSGGGLKYYVDGSPKVYNGRSQKVVVFGLRRGGVHYYALDVTDPKKPAFLWKIGPETPGYEEIGQTWSTPQIGKVRFGSGEKMVCFFGGGYDENQDKRAVALDDKKGRAVYAVDLLTGDMVWKWDHEKDPKMKHSIPSDISQVDTDGDGYIDRLYVGDTGGRLWRFDTMDSSPRAWTGRVVFDSNMGILNNKRKVFYRPDVTLEKGYEMVFFGTGDQPNSDETKVINQIYAIKDRGASSSLSARDLENVTSKMVDPKDVGERQGWYISLESNKGEKVLAPPVVAFGVAYLSTYTPPREGTNDGIARVYALSYRDGNPVFNLNPANDIDGGKIEVVDRSRVIGTGIPSATIISAMDGIPVAFTGFAGGVYNTPLKGNKTIIPIWWREVRNKK